jgi:uncharacterized secreted repeat protein (TIGR03808 family)
LVWRDAPGFDGTVVDGNSINNVDAGSGGSGQNGNGINVFRANNVVVSNNVINDCEFSAVRANLCSQVIITGNNCLNTREVALYYEDTPNDPPTPAFGAVISNNVVQDCQVGISITNFEEGASGASCIGNVIRNCISSGGFLGIGISAEADTVVSGNVIEDADGYGIKLGTGQFTRDLICTSNVVSNHSSSLTTQAGICVSGQSAGHQLVANNMVQMKSPSPGVAYGLVALDTSGAIMMTGSAPTPVTHANFSQVTVSANVIHDQTS